MMPEEAEAGGAAHQSALAQGRSGRGGAGEATAPAPDFVALSSDSDALEEEEAEAAAEAEAEAATRSAADRGTVACDEEDASSEDGSEDGSDEGSDENEQADGVVRALAQSATAAERVTLCPGLERPRRLRSRSTTSAPTCGCAHTRTSPSALPSVPLLLSPLSALTTQAATEVFVGGLSFDATEEDLQATFSVAGDIAEARANSCGTVVLLWHSPSRADSSDARPRDRYGQGLRIRALPAGVCCHGAAHRLYRATLARLALLTALRRRRWNI